MATLQKNNNTVTVNKAEYDALIHTAQVTSEFLDGKAKKFNSAEDLIENLKKLDENQ